MPTKKTLIDNKKDYSSQFATEDNKMVYHTKQNVQPVIDHVKNLKDNTIKPGKDLRHVAEVPMVIYQKAIREGWVNDRKAWKDWLNNSDNKVFRTWEGKV